MKILKIASIVLMGFSLSLTAAAKQNDYNVLLITVDTLRYDRISFHTDTYVQTPHIDKLASRSAVYHRAFAHNPVTLSSHTNIMTGTTPLFHGISDNQGFKLDARFVTLAEHLKQSGYSTAAFIAAFPLDSRFGLAQGFDLYDDNYGAQKPYSLYFAERRADEVLDPALRWISNQSDKWFGWVHLFDPHEPYDPPAPYDQQYKDDLYSGEAAYTDAQLGVLFDYLEDAGRMSDTIIILTADHGEALGDKGEITHSFFAYNSVIHIPLLVYVPGQKPAAVQENASHADIFPTVCDALGLKSPKHLQGESLLPLARGKNRSSAAIYFESLTPHLTAGWAPLRGFIRGDMKFIDLPIKEVYDLRRDLAEEVNLASKSDIPSLEKDLKRLQKDFKGKGMNQNLDEVEQDMINKMRTLGYISAGKPNSLKKYGPQDDLKYLLPIQIKMHQAISDFREGRHDQALKNLQEIISQRSDYLPAYSHMSNLFYSLGIKEQAVKSLQDGLKANRDNLYLQSRLGLMLVEVQEYDEAIKLLKRCISKENTNPDYFLYMGVAQQKSGNFDLAMANYQEALKLDKSNALVYNNIGSVHLMYFLRSRDLNEYRLAMANFNNALAFNPYLQSAINGRGAAQKFKSQLEQRNSVKY
ncbi:MAG: sulfatase-like hydrolase/transferase [Candidatus Aminicenantaceae bacterium]